MSAYLIAQINVTKEKSYKEYLSKVTPIVEKYSGENLVRGGKYEKMTCQEAPGGELLVTFLIFGGAQKYGFYDGKRSFSKKHTPNGAQNGPR